MMPRASQRCRMLLFAMALIAAALMVGCGPREYRQEADDVAYEIIDAAQRTALDREEPFSVEPASVTLRRQLLEAQDLPYSSPASLGSEALPRIKYWPEKDYPAAVSDDAPLLGNGPLVLTLDDALQIAARSNREYQDHKERVFAAALVLDLERNDFRYLLFASQDVTYIDDPGLGPDVRGLEATTTPQITKRFKNGAAVSLAVALDLVKLLTQERSETLGILADATITIPLLRGAGRHIVMEPLTQAERNVVYELYALERFKRTLAVDVAAGYLNVLQRLDQVRNNAENYRGLIVATRRAQRLGDAGRLDQIQVDQARQAELRARNSWGVSQFAYEGAMDSFKVLLGLPGDAEIALDRNELDRLAGIAEDVGSDQADVPRPVTQPAASPYDAPAAEPTTSPVMSAQQIDLIPFGASEGVLEQTQQRAVQVALVNRLDLLTAEGRVFDAQRQVVVAADLLKAELTFAGTASAGERRSLNTAGANNAELRPELGLYTASLQADLPLERTAERNTYRLSYIALEQAVRDAQELEDQIKVSVRDDVRTLAAAQETARIQATAVRLAYRRVEGAELLLQAGRAQMRDLLEAREALISAQNAASAALVAYRVAELSLQSDMGVLEIDEKGLWREYEVELGPDQDD